MAEPGLEGRRGVVLGCVMLAMFLLFLDTSLNVALPAITRDLRGSLSSIQWVIIAYLLTRSALLPSFGAAADALGLKPVFLLGLLLYTAGVGAASLVPGIPHLVLVRVLQALGTGMVWATAPALVSQAYPYGGQGRALGLMTAGGTLGMVSGPLVGGMLLELWGWRAIFWYRVPLGLVTAAVALWGIARSPRPSARGSYDLRGAFLLAAALVLLILPLSLSRLPGFFPYLLGAGGMALFGLFLAVEARSANPLVPLSLFRRRPFLIANLRGLLGYGAMFITWFLFPFFMEERLALPPLGMGLMLATVPLVASLVSPWSGWASDRLGSRGLVSAGILLMALALLLLSRFGGGAPVLPVLGSLVVMGMGFGLFQAPNYNALMAASPRERQATAASLLALATSLGAILAVSLSGAFFNWRSALYRAVYPPGVALDRAYQEAFLLFAALGALGALVSWLEGKRPARQT